MYKKRSRWFKKRGGGSARPGYIPVTPKRSPWAGNSPAGGPISNWRDRKDISGPGNTGGTISGSTRGRSDKTRGRRRDNGKEIVKYDDKTLVHPFDSYNTREIERAMRRPRVPRAIGPARPPVRNIDSKRIYPKSSGSSYSTVKLTVPVRIRMKKWPKGYKTLAQPQTYSSNGSFRLETSVGLQNMYTLTYGSTAYMKSISDLISTNYTNQFIMQDMVLTYSMTNNTNTNMFLEIWDGYYRRNTNNNATILVQNGLIDEGGTSTTINVWGLDPLKSLSFRTMCKVKAVRRVELMEGRSHQHRVYTKFGSRWTEEEYQQGTTSYLDGWSRFSMFIVRGCAINDATTTTNVSTAAVALDVVYNCKARYTYITPTTQTITLGASFPTITTPEVFNVSKGIGETDTKY